MLLQNQSHQQKILEPTPQLFTGIVLPILQQILQQYFLLPLKHHSPYLKRNFIPHPFLDAPRIHAFGLTI